MKKVKITENGIERVQFYTDKEFKVLVNGIELGAKEEPKKEKFVPKVGDCFKTAKHIYGCCTYSAGGEVRCNTWLEICSIDERLKCNAEMGLSNLGLFKHNNVFTQITPEELQAEFEKCGYHYDFESGKAVKLRGKPKVGQYYWFVTTTGIIEPYKWVGDYIDNNRFNVNNCHKSEQDAQKFRDYMKNYKNE